MHSPNGIYKGRLLVPVYSVTLAGFGVLYSDDGGAQWSYAAADTYSTGATAEAQMVEMPDGSLKVYVRTSSSHISERTSIDGGITWTAETTVSGVSTTSYGTQLSVINYSGTIDGKSAIIMSTPNSTSGRNTGIIRIGLINDTGIEGTERYTIDWKYTYTIDGAVGFSYSCLAELPNGHIGLLYEKYDSWARTQLHLKNVLPFESYTIGQLIGS
jgi:sialidase-1